MKKILFLVTFSLLIQYCEAFAGPGGIIVKALYHTLFGKIIISAIFIICAPLIIYFFIKERKAVYRTKKILTALSMHDSIFNISALRALVQGSFKEIFKAWNNEDLDPVSKYMTSWYKQNQEALYLNKNKDSDKINICKIDKIIDIEPLYICLSTEKNWDKTTIVFMIDAYVQDYMYSKRRNKVIEGDKKYKKAHYLWTYTLVDRNWLLSNIEVGAFTGQYYNLMGKLPKNYLEIIKDLAMDVKQIENY